MKYGLISIIMFFTHLLVGQPLVKVEVSADTIAVGQTVDVTYTIENGDGKFIMPDITGLPVISGPHSASSMVYQQGKMSSSQSYSFTLMAMEDGQLIVPQTFYKSNKEEIAIHPVAIVVLPAGHQPSSAKKVEEESKPTTTREKRKF